MKALFALLFCALSLTAATSNSVNINSVTVSSGTATVSCGGSNCNINANYGFCIAGTSDSTINICSTAVTGSGGTSFTFATTAGNESLGAAGTVRPAKQIIFLGESMSTAGNVVTIPYLLWLTTINPVANSANISQWGGASTAEVNAIKAGTTIEVAQTLQMPVTAFTKANAQSLAQLWFLGAQVALINGIQPAAYFGQYCDPVGCSF